VAGEVQKNYLPLFLSLAEFRCLVVGGGAVAVRKVQTLLEHDANIEVVSPRVAGELEELAKQGLIEIKRKAFSRGDLDGMNLVVVSTNDKDLNKGIAMEASKRGIICNVVDTPELCSAIFPSIYSSGNLKIAISTGGASPALARLIKVNLSRTFGEEYALALDILSKLRKSITKDDSSDRANQNRKIFTSLVDSEFIGLCEARDLEKIEDRLKVLVGLEMAKQVLAGLSNEWKSAKK
jgi:precorrin-2 dehydrogenase/sirohydrochlorin ferrochelatase